MPLTRNKQLWCVPEPQKEYVPDNVSL